MSFTQITSQNLNHNSTPTYTQGFKGKQHSTIVIDTYMTTNTLILPFHHQSHQKFNKTKPRKNNSKLPLPQSAKRRTGQRRKTKPSEVLPGSQGRTETEGRRKGFLRVSPNPKRQGERRRENSPWCEVGDGGAAATGGERSCSEPRKKGNLGHAMEKENGDESERRELRESWVLSVKSEEWSVWGRVTWGKQGGSVREKRGWGIRGKNGREGKRGRMDQNTPSSFLGRAELEIHVTF